MIIMRAVNNNYYNCVQGKILKLLFYKDAINSINGEIIPYVACHTETCVSSMHSKLLLGWLKDTTLDPMKLVVSCNWKTDNGDIAAYNLLQLVCQSESCADKYEI